jgi:hypothetical protein
MCLEIFMHDRWWAKKGKSGSILLSMRCVGSGTAEHCSPFTHLGNLGFFPTSEHDESFAGVFELSRVSALRAIWLPDGEASAGKEPAETCETPLSSSQSRLRGFVNM